MRGFIMATGAAMVAALLMPSAPGRLYGQAGEKAAADNLTLENQIYDALREVINTGADLYNRELDRAGCYRVYQGGLLMARPLLTQHPDLQRSISAGLLDVERLPTMAERAFALRDILDGVRAKLRPKPETKKSEAKPPDK